MASASSTDKIHSKIESLGERLKKMKTGSESPRLSSPTLPGSTAKRSRPTTPGSLAFGSRKKETTGIPGYTTNERVPDSAEIEARYQEIMKLAGVLTLEDNKPLQCEQSDLIQLQQLGKGTCGQVYKMRHRQTSKEMAIKKMRRSGNKEESKRIIMDLETVLKSHSPHIIHCYGIFITNEEVWICMELMSTCLDKLLIKLASPIPEEILGQIILAVLKALNYLKEQHGVIHRDVKPSNILLDQRGNIKLCDFGISGRLEDSKAQTRTGTACAGYMAPERIQPPDPSKPAYDIRADVWSLGITIVELASGEFPYPNGRNEFEVLSLVLERAPPQLDDTFSQPLRDFTRLCLTKDVDLRPKYTQLLEHEYIKLCESKKVDVASWYQQVTQSHAESDSLSNTSPSL